MKLSFLKLKTKSSLKRNKTLRTSLPYKQGVSIGVIFSAEDKSKHDLIKDFIKKLELDEKKVRVISFLPKKKENFEFLFDFFSEEDLSFWGNITSPSATSFVEASFDFLFYLDIQPNPLVLNLIARSKAKCRVGKYADDNKPFFELMIEGVENTKGLLDSMYKYTRQLR